MNDYLNIELDSPEAVRNFEKITAEEHASLTREDGQPKNPAYLSYHLRDADGNLEPVDRNGFAQGLGRLVAQPPTHEVWVVRGSQGLHCDADWIPAVMPG